MPGLIWRRLRYYPPYFLIFTVIYGVALYLTGPLPGWFVFAILGLSVAKDLIDELRIGRGEDPIAYATIEHNPSNIVLLVAIILGFVRFGPPIAGFDRATIAIAVAVFDFLLDGAQDLRTG